MNTGRNNLVYVEKCLHKGNWYYGTGDTYRAKIIFKEALDNMLRVDENPESKDYINTLNRVRKSLRKVNRSILIENVSRSLQSGEYELENKSDFKTLLRQKDNVFVKAYNMENEKTDEEIQKIDKIKRLNYELNPMENFTMEDVQRYMTYGIIVYGAGETVLSRNYLEIALKRLPFVKDSCDPEDISKTFKTIEVHLRKIYYAELTDDSGVKEDDFEKLLEQKNNPVVKDYMERNKKLDDMVLKIVGTPKQKNSHKM